MVQLRQGVESVLRLIFPTVCQLCGRHRAEPNNGFVCYECLKEVLRPLRPPFCSKCAQPFAGDITVPFRCSNCAEFDLKFDNARAVLLTTQGLLEILNRYKYRRQEWFEPLLRQIFVTGTVPEQEWDVIVPVPIHPVRLRERGFNQTERLAKWLAEQTGVELCAHALRRVRYTQSQTQLARSERFRNVKKAIGAGPEIDRVRNRNVVLIDDVLTTGATCSACAEVLMKAGAKRVVVRTLAR